MQDTQALATEQEQLAAQQLAEGQAQAGAEEQVSETELLRQSMARNYLQHCVNAAVAEQSPEAVLTGIRNALSTLILTALNVTPNNNALVLETMASTMGEVSVGEQVLPELLMEVWAVSQARQGRLNVMIGKLRDRAELDRNQFLMNQMQQLNALVADKADKAPAAPQGPKRKPKAAAAK